MGSGALLSFPRHPTRYLQSLPVPSPLSTDGWNSFHQYGCLFTKRHWPLPGLTLPTTPHPCHPEHLLLWVLEGPWGHQGSLRRPSLWRSWVWQQHRGYAGQDHMDPKRCIQTRVAGLLDTQSPEFPQWNRRKLPLCHGLKFQIWHLGHGALNWRSKH